MNTMCGALATTLAFQSTVFEHPEPQTGKKISAVSSTSDLHLKPLGPGMRLRRIRWPVLAAVNLTAVSITAFDDAFQTYPEARQFRHDVHSGILQHTANAPERYRVLVAYVTEGAIRLITPLVPYRAAFEWVYALFYLCGFAWLLWTQFAYLRIWFTDEQALVGALLIGTALRLTMQEYTPFSVLEPSFFALALLLSYRQRRWWLAALVAVASLNRETAVFLPMLFAVTSPVTKRNLAACGGLFLIWAVVFFGIRYISGDGTRVWTLDSIWAWNRHPEHLMLATQNAIMLLGALCVFAALGFRHSPEFVRRSALVGAPYIVTVLIWGTWSEIRLFTPLYPVLLPLALSYLFNRGANVRPFARPWIQAGVLLSAVVVNAYQYSFLVTRAPLRLQTHEAVLNLTGRSAGEISRAGAVLLHAPIQAAASLMRPDKAFGRVYTAYCLGALWLLLLSLLAYFKRWFSEETATYRRFSRGLQCHRTRAPARRVPGAGTDSSAAVFSPHDRV